MALPADSRTNDLLSQTSFLYGANAGFIEDLFRRYAADPGAVDPTWAALFAELGGAVARRLNGEGPSWARRLPPRGGDAETLAALTGDWTIAPPPKPNGKVAKAAPERAAPGASPEQVRQATLDSIRAIMLIRAYRVRGHLDADLDPLKIESRKPHPELEPATYGFAPSDMDRPIFLDFVLGLEFATMRQIVEICRRTYCGTIGYEFIHITDPEQKQWIQARIEGAEKGISFTPEGRKAILNKLVEAEGFEKFCATKFTGTKRFGLDGGEALVPALEQIIKRSGALGARELVIGMAHRGRLNVLANVMQKPYRAIFHEFHGGSANPSDVQGSGDVKYHLGASSDRTFDGNVVHLSLAPNPSHLEIVNPVVLGKVRVKQVQRGRGDLEEGRGMVIPVLLHGDAAFAGQGVVAECFAMSGTKGYRTGGTIHIVINNQIGFTTAPHHARSSPYPSDVALMVQAPIFHVNGDDPEAVVHVAKIAAEFRQKFRKDVVIDMFCYRRFGHNEGDEPSFTQPLMYAKIRSQPTTLALYSRRLIEEGLLSEAEVQQMGRDFAARLEVEFGSAAGYRPNEADWFGGVWKGFGLPGDGDDRKGQTEVPLETLREVGHALTEVPAGFNVHRTIDRLLRQKREMIDSGRGLDWATAEALAFGTLLIEGYPVRLSGQDSGRGTFSQRHAAIVDQQTEQRHHPLAHIRPGRQKDFEVIDSLLSEEAVLGFEYGYSTAEPRALVLWEAQFGDFVNGAQVVIDQFIASGESKWLRASGLVMLLPHGFEGQGPEHSSARIERFLQLCAEDNIQVANCTTPANYFHILRRQMHRPFRKPLVIFTPKSLLRHKRCVSSLSELGPGTSFHRVLRDDAETPGASGVALKPDAEIRRIVLSAGKVYYDLYEERERRGIDDVYLLRIEQFYPFPTLSLMRELKRFPKAELLWVQEEPRNMGGWTFMLPYLDAVLPRTETEQTRARYVGRAEAASPAAGLMRDHLAQLKALLDEALNP